MSIAAIEWLGGAIAKLAHLLDKQPKTHSVTEGASVAPQSPV